MPLKTTEEKLQLLLTNKIDGFFAEETVTGPTNALLASQPLYSTHWRIVSLADSHSRTDFNAQDLNKRKIIVVSDAPIQTLKQRYPDIFLIITPSLSEAITLLRAGAAEGVLCRQVAANVLAENVFPDLLKVSAIDSLTTETRLIVQARHSKALSALNNAIEQLPQNTFQNLLSRNFTVLTLMNIVPPLKQNHRNFDLAAIIVGVVSLFLIAYLIDQIAHRRTTERRLNDGVLFWQTLLNSLSTPVLVCDSAGMVTHVNQALCDDLQVCRVTLRGKSVEHFNQLFFNSMALDTAGLLQASSKNEPTFFEGKYLLNGQSHSISGWITPYTNTNKVPQGLVIGWFDLSERIELEAKLALALTEAKRASQQKGEFLARMSHEIRSPMNVIMGILEMENQRAFSSENRLSNPLLSNSSISNASLSSPLLLTPSLSNTPLPASPPLAIAYQASRNLLQIIGDVLDLSKIEAGEMLLAPQPVSLHALLTSSAETYKTLAAKKGLGFETDLTACFEQYYLLDKGKLAQIVNNLLSNAIKYTQRGEVALSVVTDFADKTDPQEKNQEIIISIRDSGVGIDPALLPSLIKPYRQISASSPDSSGLGLTICHQLIELMGGRLEMISTPDIGSDFRVILPLKTAIPDVLPAPHQALPVDTPRYQLWIIDDLPANLLVMQLQLTALGHQVTCFDNAREALNLLKQHPVPPVDLIFTDCQMPILDGYQFATELRLAECANEIPQHLPLIGCTANAFSDEEKKCLFAGMDGQLTKPVAQADLADCLRNMLQNRRVDLAEIVALSGGQANIIDKLISELQKSSAEDIQLIENAWRQENASELKSRVHRLKGNFALTQFAEGQRLCVAIEQKIESDERVSERQILRLQRVTQHFTSLLQRFSSI
ncbi:ATP-binding protein [Rouxiella sp. T17]|uniref:ATP-binding protein n=1 Tax=Rouxiella sp. T17 TaxID=3085684 RepID=UPI002FC672A1